MAAPPASAIAIWLAVTAVSPGPATAVRDFPDADLAPLLARVTHQEPWHAGYLPWAKLGLPDARQLILGSSPTRAAAEEDWPAKLKGAATRIGKAYGLPPAAARALLAAELYLEPKGGWFEPLPEEQALKALDAFREAAHLAPGNVAVLGAFASAVCKIGESPNYEGAFAAALEGSPHPDQVALQLSRAGLTYWGPEFSAFAATRNPKLLAEAVAAFGLGGEDREDTLFYLAAFRAITVSPSSSFPEELAERLLRNLLRNRNNDLALDIFSRIPAASRANLLAGRWKARNYHYESGLRASGTEVALHDVRLDLAAALTIAGRQEEGRAWLKAAASPSPLDVPGGPALDPRAVESQEFQRLVLERRIGRGVGEDAFDLLLANSQPDDLATNVLFAEVISPQFPQRARGALQELRMGIEHERPMRLLMREHLSFLDGAEKELSGDRSKAVSVLSDELKRLSPASGTPAPTDPVSEGIARRLAGPPLQVFVERSAKDIQSSEKSTWSALDPRDLNVPRDFSVVRAERSANRIVVLALSHRLDPCGEVSGGGYWLMLSDDGGSHWRPPVYTGLREYRPYELEANSKIPMISGVNGHQLLTPFGQ